MNKFIFSMLVSTVVFSALNAGAFQSSDRGDECQLTKAYCVRDNKPLVIEVKFKKAFQAQAGIETKLEASHGAAGDACYVYNDADEAISITAGTTEKMNAAYFDREAAWGQAQTGGYLSISCILADRKYYRSEIAADEIDTINAKFKDSLEIKVIVPGVARIRHD